MTRVVALAVMLGACSDEVDLSGTYRVESHVASAPCGADQPVAMPAVTLVFTRGDLYGTAYFNYERCTDEAATACSGLFGDAFAEPIDGGWQGIVTSASGGATCTISYTRQTAILTGTSLVVDISRYAEQVETATQCTPEEADRRNTSMPCADHERIAATRR